MREHIVVVGGYGQVGQSVSRLLAERFPGKVYAAGRNLIKAEQFCSATDGAVKPMLLDVSRLFHPGDEPRKNSGHVPGPGEYGFCPAMSRAWHPLYGCDGGGRVYGCYGGAA
ncbi:hypothetical protein [Paenibacillus mesotrionivorans]|uniref:Uncharacterized protein n=1 Tax=Paenibacillus mesotrionivorans TaxID=3160968 RepID=A0ACC7NZ63_9BACL